MLLDNYECEGQMDIEQCMQCIDCANEGSKFCIICSDGDFHMTQDEKAYNDFMCDIMCGGPEDDWQQYMNQPIED